MSTSFIKLNVPYRILDNIGTGSIYTLVDRVTNEEITESTVPAASEVYFYPVENGYRRIKVGDGKTPLSGLPWAGAAEGSTDSYTLSKSGSTINLNRNGITVSSVTDATGGGGGTGNVSYKGEFTTTNYTAGDLVTYEGKLYFITSDFYSGDGRPVEYFPWLQLSYQGNSIGTTDSFEIFDGEASAEYSIAAGTNDKSSITPIIGNTLASMVTVEVPKASGVGSFAVGGGAEATSAGALAMGSLNRVGVKGLYYSSINASSKTITLSTSRSATAGSNLAATYGWAVGDTVGFVNGNKYPAYTTITAISGNVITVNNLPSEIKTYSSILSTTYLPDDFTIYACYKKTIVTGQSRWYPRNGAVELGWAGSAFGVENLVSGSAGLAAGWNNWTAGDFGATFGRDNITGYAGMTSGRENTNKGAYSAVFGANNLVEAPNALVAGQQNVSTGKNSVVFGKNNTVSGQQTVIVGSDNQCVNHNSLVVGKWNKNTTSGSGSQSLMAGIGLTMGSPTQTVLGQYNQSRTSKVLVIGWGTGNDTTGVATEAKTICTVNKTSKLNTNSAVNGGAMSNKQYYSTPATPSDVVTWGYLMNEYDNNIKVSNIVAEDTQGATHRYWIEMDIDIPVERATGANEGYFGCFEVKVGGESIGKFQIHDRTSADLYYNSDNPTLNMSSFDRFGVPARGHLSFSTSEKLYTIVQTCKSGTVIQVNRLYECYNEISQNNLYLGTPYQVTGS
jgi:hypothetical protein